MHRGTFKAHFVISRRRISVQDRYFRYPNPKPNNINFEPIYDHSPSLTRVSKHSLTSTVKQQSWPDRRRSVKNVVRRAMAKCRRRSTTANVHMRIRFQIMI